jgi:nicotinamidase-related amidase
LCNLQVSITALKTTFNQEKYSMKALLCLDFENDIVHPEGKVASKGYAAFNQTHKCLLRAAQTQSKFRQAGFPVLHIRVGFSASYAEQPKTSPLMGQAHNFGAFKLDSWGTEFLSEVAPFPDELIITKHRVGAFYGTALNLTLKTMGIKELFLIGVATDMVVESTAREAHDRDFVVTIISDCCIAANDKDHQRSLENMQKLSTIVTTDTLELS